MSAKCVILKLILKDTLSNLKKSQKLMFREFLAEQYL